MISPNDPIAAMLSRSAATANPRSAVHASRAPRGPSKKRRGSRIGLNGNGVRRDDDFEELPTGTEELRVMRHERRVRRGRAVDDDEEEMVDSEEEEELSEDREAIVRDSRENSEENYIPSVSSDDEIPEKSRDKKSEYSSSDEEEEHSRPNLDDLSELSEDEKSTAPPSPVPEVDQMEEMEEAERAFVQEALATSGRKRRRTAAAISTTRRVQRADAEMLSAKAHAMARSKQAPCRGVDLSSPDVWKKAHSRGLKLATAMVRDATRGYMKDPEEARIVDEKRLGIVQENAFFTVLCAAGVRLQQVLAADDPSNKSLSLPDGMPDKAQRFYTDVKRFAAMITKRATTSVDRVDEPDSPLGFILQRTSSAVSLEVIMEAAPVEGAVCALTRAPIMGGTLAARVRLVHEKPDEDRTREATDLWLNDSTRSIDLVRAAWVIQNPVLFINLVVSAWVKKKNLVGDSRSPYIHAAVQNLSQDEEGVMFVSTHYARFAVSMLRVLYLGSKMSKLK